MTLSLGTAYRSFGGEVEASSTPTICRLPDSRRHQLWAIARKWIEMTIPADPLYQHVLLTAEKKFWRCVETGETPRLFGVEPPRPRLEAVRMVDMTASNAWAEFSGLF